MNYKIYIGNEKCTKCGKSHKKVFEIDGRPYGSSCAMEILGKNLSAPLWLYELAEKWVQQDSKETEYAHIEDCSTNFINHHATNTLDRDGVSKVWLKTIKIKDKNVKAEWQLEINDYIVKRYTELKEEN
ncbi:hypothetical protein [Priestia megaterium]|uniref:hypothetical protein n=1 Tax=Priestia megaterium TaxID=1404 RepID=UPI000BFB9DE0|nr:hypothetical protein [Priestia megaterium]PGO60656.1 hypothetical protein CN981_08895 [Priestia megaterium]